MKAPIAQAGGQVASPQGCAFLFFWGLEIVKCILKTRASAGATAAKVLVCFLYYATC
jgi:hypothetical protein